MLWITVALALALASILLLRWIFPKHHLRLPPSPRGLPLFGHFHLLGRLPQVSLTHLAKTLGPLMYMRLGSVPLIVVSSPAMAKEFLKVHDSEFAHRPPRLVVQIFMYNCKSLSYSEGEYWKTIRRLCSMELFTARRVTSFTHILRDELWELCSELFKASSTGEAVAMRGKLRGLSFNVMTRILMNKVYFGSNASGDPAMAEDARLFVKLIDDVLAVAGAFSVSDYFKFPGVQFLDPTISVTKQVHHRMDMFLNKVLDEQRPGEVPDFVEMTKARITSPEQSQYLKALLMDLLLGGSETSSTVTEWALAELIHNPQWMAKVQQEIESVVGHERMVEESDLSKLDHLNAVIKETFRLHPPLALMVPHTSFEPCKVAGYDIPAKAIVLLNAYAIGRDDEAWENPDEFRPERFLGSSINVYGHDFSLLPFGSGRRACPGLPLGLRNVQLLVSNLVHGFDWTFPKDGGKPSLNSGPGFINVMADVLTAQVTPRLPQHAVDTLKKK